MVWGTGNCASLWFMFVGYGSMGVPTRVFHEYCFRGQGLVFTADSHLALFWPN